MRYLSAICLFGLFSIATFSANAQGENNPGYMSTGAMRTASGLLINDEEFETQRPQISVGHAFAKGERHLRLNTTHTQIRVPLFGEYSGGYFDFNIPIFSASGELGNSWGLDDVTATYTHMFTGLEDWLIQGTLGLNIGMSTANQTDGKARPLPMAYQPGRGSTDVIAGGSITWKRYITLAAGYQQPIFRYNENDFFAANKINDTLYSALNYTIARKLYRQGDVMLRLEGHYYNNRWGITAGGVANYHLANDLYEDRNTNLWHEIDGTQGLTVNITGNVFMRFGRYGEYKIDLTGATPVVRTDTYSAGLYRQWMLMPRFTFYFNSKQSLLMF